MEDQVEQTKFCSVIFATSCLTNRQKYSRSSMWKTLTLTVLGEEQEKEGNVWKEERKMETNKEKSNRNDWAEI